MATCMPMQPLPMEPGSQRTPAGNSQAHQPNLTRGDAAGSSHPPLQTGFGTPSFLQSHFSAASDKVRELQQGSHLRNDGGGAVSAPDETQRSVWEPLLGSSCSSAPGAELRPPESLQSLLVCIFSW